MLLELHQAIQELIYRDGRIDRAEVDITFEVPTRDFVDRLVRPTIDLYLVDVVENTDLRQAQFQATQTEGRARFRALPRRIDLRYVVTALTTNADDGFRLMWRVLGVLMRTPELPADSLPHELTLDFPILGRAAQPDSGTKLLDVWSAVGGEPRPAFCYVVTAPMDLDLSFEVPLVLSHSVAYRSLNGNGGPESRPVTRGAR